MTNGVATATTDAGRKRQVWEGRATVTRPYGLRKADLKVSKSTGKIVSRRASEAAAKNYKRNGLEPNRLLYLYQRSRSPKKSSRSPKKRSR